MQLSVKRLALVAEEKLGMSRAIPFPGKNLFKLPVWLWETQNTAEELVAAPVSLPGCRQREQKPPNHSSFTELCIKIAFISDTWWQMLCSFPKRGSGRSPGWESAPVWVQTSPGTLNLVLTGHLKPLSTVFF